jgi:hypothetical protein
MMFKNVFHKESHLLWENTSPVTMIDLYSRLKFKVVYFEIITMTDVCEWYSQTKCFSKDLKACNMQDAKVLCWTYAYILVLEYQVWYKKLNFRSRLWYSHEYERYQVKW